MAPESAGDKSEAPCLERLDPNDRNDHQAAQHWARYEWACRFLPADRVLDCACGLGYGTSLLRSRGAAACVGVDVSAEAVEQARARYAQPGVEFLHTSALDLSPQSHGRFDRIVSLETIEHIADPQRFLDVFQSLLAPDGILILSCPNDIALGVDNPYHLWRAELAELQSWLGARFSHVSCHAEAHTLGVMVLPAEWMNQPKESAEPRPLVGRVVDTMAYASSPGFLFACANRPLPQVPPVAAEVLNGVNYLHELERVKDKLWAELQQLRETWETQNRRVLELEQVKDNLWAEVQTLSAEAKRLGEAWSIQNAYIKDVEARKNQLQSELAEYQNDNWLTQFVRRATKKGTSPRDAAP